MAYAYWGVASPIRHWDTAPGAPGTPPESFFVQAADDMGFSVGDIVSCTIPGVEVLAFVDEAQYSGEAVAELVKAHGDDVYKVTQVYKPQYEEAENADP